MSLPDDIKNRIERELKQSRLDPSQQAKRAAEMVIVAAGRPVHFRTREKLEQLFADGISPNRIENAIAIVAEEIATGKPNV